MATKHQPRKGNQSTAPSEIRAAALRGYRYYVYALADASGVFYVGKGTRGRLFQHGRSGQDNNHAKLARIAAGSVRRTVTAYFRHEADALAHERQLIGSDAQLTNIAPGRRSPREAAQDRARAMLARIVPFEQCTGRHLPFYDTPMGRLTARELYDATVAAIRQEAERPTPTSIERNPATGQFTYGWG